MTILRQLSELLRDQTKWPDDFVWDYDSSNTCAIGLACAAGLVSKLHTLVSHRDFPGLTEIEFTHVFYSSGKYTCSNDVPPDDVADRIDELLED